MLILILSYLADLIFGQPQNSFHPVRVIGWITEKLENILNKGKDAKIRQINGAIMTFIVIGVTMCIAYLAIEFLKVTNDLLGLLVSVYVAYISFTLNVLIKSADNVFDELKGNSLVAARKNLAKIVTRDTKNLDEEHIIKSTIESTAENLNDSVVAPLFYLIIGGPVMAIGYRAANTLDAMVGYKNQRYINFGWFSARFDDVLNFIPARITGILICISASILENNGRKAFQIMLRDGRKHESPNAGISEAAMAGALGIKIGGCYSYPNGKKKCREEIGDDCSLGNEKRYEKNLIKKCVNICFVVSVFMMVIGVVIKIIYGYL